MGTLWYKGIVMENENSFLWVVTSLRDEYVITPRPPRPIKHTRWFYTEIAALEYVAWVKERGKILSFKKYRFERDIEF